MMTTLDGETIGFRLGLLSTLPVTKKRPSRFSIFQQDVSLKAGAPISGKG
jgi:hypothetical protein